jgi:hypothetical protein
MVMRSTAAFALCLFALAGCQTPVPLTATPSFTTSPALAARNPAEVAVLSPEDATETKDAGRLLEYMREVMEKRLVDRCYTPLRTQVVDASLGGARPGRGETVLTPAYLKRIAGRAREEALLAVRIDRWDERSLLADKMVSFEFQAALIGNDGEALWHGSLSGQVNATGFGAAPRDRDAMARKCADIALDEMLKHLPSRPPSYVPPSSVPPSSVPPSSGPPAAGRPTESGR